MKLTKEEYDAENEGIGCAVLFSMALIGIGLATMAIFTPSTFTPFWVWWVVWLVPTVLGGLFLVGIMRSARALERRWRNQ